MLLAEVRRVVAGRREGSLGRCWGMRTRIGHAAARLEGVAGVVFRLSLGLAFRQLRAVRGFV